MADPKAWTFTQLGGDKKELVLSGADAPHGRPRNKPVVRRGLKIEYFIFTDPLIILSGAILLERFSDLRFHRWAFPIAATLFGLHIAVGQAEPIKYAFMRKGPQSICEWNRYYMPLMPVPWCPS